ncbi:MAG: hypothetical protein ACJ0RQ_06870 [Candidatus Azotimanducaceae bacterium]
MKPEEMSKAIILGASLSSVMVPDPKLPSNQPAHDETYAFDYIFLREEKFFAVTREDHRTFRNFGENRFSESTSFTYSYGYHDLMTTSSSKIQWSAWSKMSFRYSKFHWRLKNDHALVWDSDQSDRETPDVSLLREAILEGRRFKVSLLDEDGLWNVMPVDLVNLEQATSVFSVRTSTAYVPAVIANEDGQRETFDFIESALSYPEFSKLPMNIIPIYFAIFSDGTYYNIFDEASNETRQFQRLLVFASDFGEERAHVVSQI